MFFQSHKCLVLGELTLADEIRHILGRYKEDHVGTTT